MAEISEIDIPRKRHLTPGSEDVRAVVQKTEETDDSSELEECDNIDMEDKDSLTVNNEDGATDVGKLNAVSAKVKISIPVFKALKWKDDAFTTRLAETGCTVQLPKKKKKPVTVFGSTEKDVQLACKLLKSGLLAEKPKPDADPRRLKALTHFVSLRLTESPQRERFAEFQTKLRDVQPDRELLPDRLIQRPEKLHISLSMLRLPDEAAREAARGVLEDCCQELRDQPPLDFRLRGLGTFGSASRTRVLFSRPEGAERLQAAARLLHGRLREAGLADGGSEDITLHATLLNTTFLTQGTRQFRGVKSREFWRKFRGFDFGSIAEQLGEFDLGEVCPEAFEISSLTGKADDGYYASIGRCLLRNSDVPHLEESIGQSSDGAEARVVRSAQECSPDDKSESKLPEEALMLPSTSGEPPSRAG